MSSKLFFSGCLVVLLFMAGFRYSIKKQQPHPISREVVYKHRSAIQCSPDWTQLNADSLADGIGVLPGWGSYRWNINTTADSARYYFN